MGLRMKTDYCLFCFFFPDVHWMPESWNSCLSVKLQWWALQYTVHSFHKHNSVVFLWFYIKSPHTQRVPMTDFCLFRERSKDPHIQWSDELHEPSTYFRHRSWRCRVHPTADGEEMLSRSFASISHEILPKSFLLFFLPQEKPPENTTTVWV